jgi:hypothetical protein
VRSRGRNRGRTHTATTSVLISSCPLSLLSAGPGVNLTRQRDAADGVRTRRAHTRALTLGAHTVQGCASRGGARARTHTPPPAVTGLCHSLSAGTASHRETTRTPHNTRCAWRTQARSSGRHVPMRAATRHAGCGPQGAAHATPRHTQHHGSSLSATQPYALAWPAPRPRITGKLTVRTIQAVGAALLTGHLQGRPMAPPARTPAFTTPRRTYQADYHIAIGQPCRQGAHWVP